MRVLIDVCHPAHAHFFRNPIRILAQRGHEVTVTSRDKEMTLGLLDDMGFEHRVLSTEGGGGLVALGRELWQRDWALARVARAVRPEVMTAIGGTFVAHAGALTGIPSLVFYDTENARLQNLLTYPFSACVVAPRAYGAWLPRRNIRYPGYHELSYLHPNVFNPNREIAIANGLAPEEETFLIRLVSWRANHDIGEKGWNDALLRAVVSKLSGLGKVLISAESPLPPDLEGNAYRGNPAAIHHLMAFLRLYVGESATMASECAVLGTPALYAAHTGRGYTDEQERRFGLVKNIRRLALTNLVQAMDEMLAEPSETWTQRRRQLLEDCIEVAPFVAACIEGWKAMLGRRA